jgi:hypothetical protein
MIIHVAVILNEIFHLGRNYRWQPPKRCPRCHCFKLWGHGYRDTFFEGYSSPIPLRRWRCPQCGCVICYRPKDYFPRFQTPIQTIRWTLVHRLQCGRWPPGFVRCRVGKDRTVTIDGRLFEAPVGLIGKQVELRYHQESPEAVELFFNQQSHGFVRPVDLHVNCRVKREKNSNTQSSSDKRPYQGGRLRFGGSDEG